jgi:hypothetical protein
MIASPYADFFDHNSPFKSANVPSLPAVKLDVLDTGHDVCQRFGEWVEREFGKFAATQKCPVQQSRGLRQGTEERHWVKQVLSNFVRVSADSGYPRLVLVKSYLPFHVTETPIDLPDRASSIILKSENSLTGVYLETGGHVILDDSNAKVGSWIPLITCCVPHT